MTLPTSPILDALRAQPSGLSQHELALATGLDMETVYVALTLLLKQVEIRAMGNDPKVGRRYVARK